MLLWFWLLGWRCRCGELAIWLAPGVVLAAILRYQLRGAGARQFEELKYFPKRDQPHPVRVKRRSALR